MRKSYAALMLTVAVLCCGAGYTDDAVVVNAGFEDLDEAGWASGWEIWPDALPGGASVSVDANVQHEGQRSLRLSHTRSTSYTRAQQSIAVDPNASYLFYVWMKCEGVEPGDGSQGARLFVEKSTGSSATPLQKGTSGWRRLRLGPLAMKGATHVTLMCYLHMATGSVWFDDLRMIKLTGEIEEDLAQESVRRQLAGDAGRVRAAAFDLGDDAAAVKLDEIEERVLHVKLPTEVDYRAGPPYNAPHAEIFRVLAGMNAKRAVGEGPVVAWVADPFEPMKGACLIPEERSLAAERLMCQDERDQALICLSNVTGEDVTVGVEVAPFAGEDAPTVTVREMMSIDLGGGGVSPDPLPLLDEADGARSMTLSPGVLKGVWLQIDSQGAEPGEYRTSVVVTPRAGEPVEATVDVRVLPLRMPDKKPIVTWGYSYEYYWIMPEVWDLASKDLVDHHINAYCWPSRYIPFPELNEDGTLEALDWSGFEAGIASHPKITWLLLWPGFEWEPNFKLRLDLEPGSDEWERVFRAWFPALLGGLEERGFGRDRVAWYLCDEPISSGRARAVTMAGKLIRELSPESYVLANPYRAAPWNLLRMMDPAVNLWCPSLPWAEGEHLEFFQEGSDILWTYQVLAKRSDPFHEYRRCFWDCWAKGSTGHGFWCYADAHGSNWDPYDEGRGDYSPVYDGDEREMIPGRRWEAWREGVEDYTLLWMLREAVERGRGSEADRAQASELLADLPGRVLTENSAAELADARRQVLEALMRLR